MSDEPVIPTFVPPLVTLLAHAEREKGSPLGEAEVARIRDRGVCIMLPISEASKVAAARGYDDIDPENVWHQWQQIRQHLPKTTEPPKQKNGRFRYVAANTSLDQLPANAKERHEAFVEIFGRQLFSLRNETVEIIRAAVEASQEVRDRMGRLNSQEYTAVANLPKDAQQAAFDLSRKAVDLMLQHLLILFTHNGLSIDIAFGNDHAIAYEILLKVVGKDNLATVEEHVVNKDGEKVFSEYYGRWLNRHGDA